MRESLSFGCRLAGEVKVTATQAPEIFHFGSSQAPIFGCFETPSDASARSGAVLICQPVADEFVRFHRSYRDLARRLCRIGFAVLRFDFFACGDSAGRCEEGCVARWRVDLRDALEELKARSNAERVRLVGMRMGATVAALECAGRVDLEGMVLWDPVPSGRQYLEELSTRHRDMLRLSHLVEERDGRSGRELLGHRFGDLLLEELRFLSLLALERKSSERILIVESGRRRRAEALELHLRRLGGRVESVHLPNPELWAWREDFGTVHIRHDLVQTIIAWICRLHL